MNLEAIADRLALNTRLERKSIFVTEMPAACDIGILLMGSYGGTPINHELPGYYETEFRVVVRHTDYVAGRTLATKASQALTSHIGFTAGDMLVRQCLPANLPRPYRRSAGGYWEFEVDVQVTFVVPGG
jgi:hypothetical protein